MWFKVKCYDIDYCVEEEDIIDCFDPFEELSKEEIESKIKEVKESLPKEVILKIWCDDEDDLDDDLIVDELTDETGWLINGFQYEII